MEDPRIVNQDTENKKKKITADEVVETKKHLATKGVMLLVAAVIVVVVLAVLGIAWYTRVANSYSVTFTVADYDLAINNHTDDKFLLEVYDYSQVTNKRFAPGAVGWLPLEISAEYSQVDLQFNISIANHMPDEIRRHFRTFVLCTDVTVDPETGEIEYTYLYGDALENESDITGGIESGDYIKRYLDDDDQVITDTITKGEEKMLCIYWEWYFDAYRANQDHPETDASGEKTFEFYLSDGTKKTWDNLSETEKAGVVARWDNLDTDMGRYPEKYKESLVMSLNASGAQIKPSDGTKVTTQAPETTTTTAPEP